MPARLGVFWFSLTCMGGALLSKSRPGRRLPAAQAVRRLALLSRTLLRVPREGEAVCSLLLTRTQIRVLTPQCITGSEFREGDRQAVQPPHSTHTRPPKNTVFPPPLPLKGG